MCAQCGGNLRVLRRNVVEFLGVGHKIIQLGLWRADEFPAASLDGEQLAPAKVETWIVRLCERDCPDDRFPRPSALQTCRAMKGRCASYATIDSRLTPSIPDGTGRPVRSSSVGVTSTSRARPRTRRPLSVNSGEPIGGAGRRRDDQRDVERGAVQEDAVGRLAVLVNRLAVIGGVHDHGVAAELNASSASSKRATWASAYITSPA